MSQPIPTYIESIPITKFKLPELAKMLNHPVDAALGIRASVGPRGRVYLHSVSVIPRST